MTMTYAVDNEEQGWLGWYSYEQLQHMATLMDDGDYQPDSPAAHFITGYHTDSFAEEAQELIGNIWEEYVDDCENDEVTPTWDDCWDNHVWESFDYQLLHTWLRVTNLHLEDDVDIKKFAKESDYCTMQEQLGL